MQIAGTREAFEAMIQERGIYKRLGVDRSTVSTWKSYLKDGNKLSLDKMEEILIKAGATSEQDVIWEVPKATFSESMLEFHDILDSTTVDEEIVVDFSDDVSEVLVNNALNRFAMKHKVFVLRDDSRRPIVKYTFDKINP